MPITRVIPCLLLKGSGFCKTVGFRKPTYLGDPVNILRIFNEKGVDEIFVLDIGATPAGARPNLALLKNLATECFMPLGYGGGVSTAEQAFELYRLGFEKVAFNTAAFERPDVITRVAEAVGSQSVVVSIDIRRKMLGHYEVVTRCGSKATGREPVDYAVEMRHRGAGEILLTSIDRDGTMQGYDLELVRRVAAAVDVPVIALGGAGSVRDFAAAVEVGASAVAAGSLFVFHGPHRAVLINMPDLSAVGHASCVNAGISGSRS